MPHIIQCRKCPDHTEGDGVRERPAAAVLPHCTHWTPTGPKTGQCSALARAVHLSQCGACKHKSPPPGAAPVAVTVSAPKRAGGGPGTELKKLLKKIGITSSPTCACNAHARTMDEWGAEKCAANIPVIVGWLREEAAKRKLPFVDFAATMLVKRAIRRAGK